MDITVTAPTAVPAPPETDYLDQIAPAQPGEEDDDDFSDDPDVIFRREYSKLDTIPLQAPVPIRVYVFFCLVFASFFAGSMIGFVTYPTVTVTIVPIAQQQTLTTSLDVQTRQLAPVTLTKAQTAPTTGRGHHVARQATGILTFYNGNFSSQVVPAGTSYTGRDGVKIVTSEAITIPAAQPPQFARASIDAHALAAGASGNIAPGDINLALSGDLLVKNVTAFTGGRDARDFQAVAPTDLTALTSTLQAALAQQVPQAFTLRPGESVTPTTCHFTTSADHGAGEEATRLTITAAYTCKGVAYNSQELERKATAAFTHQTNPGAPYELLHTTQPHVVSLAPFTVQVRGTWVYVLSQDYEQFLAEKIAGDSPQEARDYLLRTGVITRANVPAPLPKDPGHIHFVLLIEG